VGASAGGEQPLATLECTIRWSQIQDLATLGP